MRLEIKEGVGISKWDTLEFGSDEQYVAVANQEEADKLDDALNIQTINIKMPKDIVVRLNAIADALGINYQALVRTILTNYTLTAPTTGSANEDKID